MGRLILVRHGESIWNQQYEITTGIPHVFDFNEQMQLTGEFIMKD